MIGIYPSFNLSYLEYPVMISHIFKTVHSNIYLSLIKTVLIFNLFLNFRGQLLCNMGDHLNDKLCSCLPIFLDRLKNEITRLTTVKALVMVAG